MSDSSDLSSAPSDDEMDLQLKKKDGILKFFSKVPKSGTVPRVEISPPPRKKREPSPEHEYTLADNPDIAFIVMFRSRFNESFPKSCPHFGPQELETDIVDSPPGDRAEGMLCALLGLLLNRKQDVKAGHYNRALEEAIAGHKSQWPKTWEKNPLSGGATFGSMIPTERLILLRTMIHWALSSSDVIKAQITASYKQNRHEDDLNQPLSVQPWGSDGDKRRYYLIEGLDDTHFRVFRESNHLGIKRLWQNKAGSIEELKALAEKLELEDGGQKARLLSSKMLNAIPRFEATEEKRKRREYRQVRKQQFKRPEPGFSMYEGRTRGKRMKYTYEEEDDDMYSDSTSARRSTRNTRGHTPNEPVGPTVTQSGRQVKQRQGGLYGESALSGVSYEVSEDELADGVAGRSRRSWSANDNDHARAGRIKIDNMSSDEDDASEVDYGGDESEGDDNAYEENGDEEDDEDDAEEDIHEELLPEEEIEKKSLIVKLPVKTPTPEPKSPVLTLKEQPPLPSSDPQAYSEPQSEEKASEIASKPVDIPTIHPQVPGSPLAFRGSPSKPNSFPASVNVN